jgi:hemerythrin
MIGFQNVVNCYMRTKSFRMLGFGQLGCSGFVVVNKDGRFVNTKTRAYLEYGDQAFSHVEALLLTLIDDNIDIANEKKDPQESSELSSRTVSSFAPVESIGVDSMDQEHKDCLDAMNQVMKDPSKINLKNLHNVVKSHFDHEEKLMNEFFNHSNDSNALSMIRMHVKDHLRILDLIESEIHNTNQSSASSSSEKGSSTSCGSCCKIKVAVDISFLQRLATSFQVHVKNFDGLYKGVIPSRAH